MKGPNKLIETETELIFISQTTELIFAGTRASAELKRFEVKHNINPILNYMPMICQGAVFTSMFFAIKGMAACPGKNVFLT